MDTKEQIITELARTLQERLDPPRHVIVRRDHGCWELVVRGGPKPEKFNQIPRMKVTAEQRPHYKLVECSLAEEPHDERVYITLKEDYDQTKIVRLSDPDWIDNFLTNTVFFLAHVP